MKLADLSQPAYSDPADMPTGSLHVQ
jgi:hypothetical protein